MYEDYNNKSYSITAEQSKEVELRQGKEFLVYYLRKALGMVGDMKISEAVAHLEKELEPKFEPSILNLKLESKDEEFKVDNKDDNTVYERVVVRNEDGEDEESNLELFKKLQRFWDEHCTVCGSQRCPGVYDKEWRDGCELYKKEFCE